MSIVINLPPDKEKKLELRAQGRGLDIPAYIGTLIERDIVARPPIDEILEPIRREFASNNISEEDLDLLIDDARGESWREKHNR